MSADYPCLDVNKILQLLLSSIMYTCEITQKILAKLCLLEICNALKFELSRKIWELCGLKFLAIPRNFQPFITLGDQVLLG